MKTVKGVANIRNNETGEVRQHAANIQIDSGVHDPWGVWSEGNYSCDCNRELFFYDHEKGPEGLKCGDGVRFSVNIEVDGEIVYQEYAT